MGQDVWQISSGPASRSYAEVFLRHGVALIGPGDAGPWSPERDDGESEGAFVRRFASEPQFGDAILVRSGLSRIRAVGLVASEYLHLEAFDDVNSYDLQHARCMRWSELPAEYAFAEPVFGANPPRFSGVQDRRVRDYVRRFLNSPPTHWQESALPPLPDAWVHAQPALDQAMAYVRDLGAACDVLVTDGIRHRMYACEKDFAPVAYANLARLKRSAGGLFAGLARP
jgi:hypothetical protein